MTNPELTASSCLANHIKVKSENKIVPAQYTAVNAPLYELFTDKNIVELVTLVDGYYFSKGFKLEDNSLSDLNKLKKFAVRRYNHVSGSYTQVLVNQKEPCVYSLYVNDFENIIQRLNRKCDEINRMCINPNRINN